MANEGEVVVRGLGTLRIGPSTSRVDVISEVECRRGESNPHALSGAGF